MEDAYLEATTGVETGQPLIPVSKRDEYEEQQLAAANGDQTDDAQSVTPVPQNSYDRYIENYYDQLQRLVVAPKNPVMREPTQVRMLVLPYASHDQSVMYMARHIYWVHQKPQFILGDYMTKPAEILDNPMMQNRGE
ncbi:hypothetical protein BFV94_4596 [Alteromonas macleodii]|uniref:Uncharacterized protein n=2 Tax=Alteromonas macleodii TaxID=28108 RepID=A0AB36FRR6_ALTMA|nr:hypothetical protein BFV95_4606 [Alteromonas macleodii]OES25125.1 hypothetical protein BFV94_4596 [Alteromonas macleodii]OES39167.1 hypothetical protein BFV96_4315 [Alteromonas macleodii]